MIRSPTLTSVKDPGIVIAMSRGASDACWVWGAAGRLDNTKPAINANASATPFNRS